MFMHEVIVEQFGDELGFVFPESVCEYLGVRPGDVLVGREEGDRLLFSRPDTPERSVTLTKSSS